MGRVRHIHFVGIGGAGMSGIAEVLKNLGYEVSGTDINESSTTRHLQSMGIRVDLGHEASHVNGSDVVVYSSAVSADNPELQSARQKRIPVIRRAQMLAELMRFHSGIAVAGTHGKTTTTSLIASLLAEGGYDPTYVIGGLLNSAGSHARLGKGRYLVAEADESDASFHHLQPVIAVLTNIDPDHLENYGDDFSVLKSNFADFLNRLPFYGLAVVCVDNPGSREIMRRIACSFITYGIENEADFSASRIRHDKNVTEFEVCHGVPQTRYQVRLNLPGRHNVLNALAAIAVATELGVARTAIIRALAGFQGIGRRCQILGDIRIDDRALLLIDDYAHHPAEIAATLSAVRSGWPGRRLVVIFQPHRYTRTRYLLAEFADVLSTVDALVLLGIYAAGETPIAGVTGTVLYQAVRDKGGCKPVYVEQLEDVHAVLHGLVRDQDILLILGAGSIGALGGQLVHKYGQAIN
jgi:UDP-N-acetylmuramate--alanine ligase